MLSVAQSENMEHKQCVMLGTSCAASGEAHSLCEGGKRQCGTWRRRRCRQASARGAWRAATAGGLAAARRSSKARQRGRSLRRRTSAAEEREEERGL